MHSNYLNSYEILLDILLAISQRLLMLSTQNEFCSGV